MKKLLASSIPLLLFFACNSNSNKDSRKDTIKTYDQVGVKNVNGNIPDTSNAIDLTHKLDTIGDHKDSTK